MDRKEKKYRRVALAVTVCLVLVPGCVDKVERSDKPVVVVSVLPQSYFVERIAGDLVDVIVMIPPGASPATYEPTMQQMISLAKASLYVKVGHPNFSFEKAWLDRILSHSPNLKVVNSSREISYLAGDPHVWVSPKCVRKMAKGIAAALKGLIPSQEKKIDTGLRGFLADIDTLDQDIAQAFSKAGIRRFYVFHPAWGYLAREHGLEQVSIEQGSKEPSLEEIKKIVSSARSDETKVIFAQPQMSHKSANIVAREIGGRVVAIDPLSRDWLKSMRNAVTALGEAMQQ